MKTPPTLSEKKNHQEKEEIFKRGRTGVQWTQRAAKD